MSAGSIIFSSLHLYTTGDRRTSKLQFHAIDRVDVSRYI